MSDKPKKQGVPTRRAGGLPRNPGMAEDIKSARSMRNRPRGAHPPKGDSFPPTKPPKPAKPGGRSGCTTLFWIVVIVGVLILIVKAKSGH